MSLHFLGLKRQLSSSPTSTKSSPAVVTSPQNLAIDSKDVLVQRLADLAQRLEASDDVTDADITSLHLDVDRIEQVLRSKSAPVKSPPQSQPQSPSTPRRPGAGSLGSFTRGLSSFGDSPGEDRMWGSPLSPSRHVHMRMPNSPTRLESPEVRNSHQALLQATADVPATADGGAEKKRVARLAKEAEELAVKLEAAVSELAERKEESDHIHDLLTSRCDRSDQRILHLEHDVNVLQYDFTTISSKLSFLRVQLKALEVEGQRYIPFNADAELSTSIRNWKLEWADVDMRTKKAKRRCDDALASSQEGRGAGNVSRESSFTSVG